MRRILPVICLIAVLSSGLFAQKPAARLSFEVASIKPSEPLNPQAILSGTRTIGLNITESRVSIGYLSIADLVASAYKLKPFQVAGPDWIRQARFDINAKIPDGGTKEQVPDMLKSLLEERFNLKVHTEMREHSVYALIVNKGGVKFKEAPAEDPAAKPEEGGQTATLPGGVQIRQTGRGASITSEQTGPVQVSAGPDGTIRMEMGRISMSSLSEMLSPMVDRPVVDKTEMKGNYQLTLELSMETMMAVARASAAQTGIDIGALGGARGNPFGGAAGQASDPSSGGIFASIQQLGLKLDSQKAPVETVIVDSAEKAPTEN